jgi:hypothetical protein
MSLFPHIAYNLGDFGIELIETFFFGDLKLLDFLEYNINLHEIGVHLPLQLYQILHDVNFVSIFIHHVLSLVFILLFPVFF